MDLIETGLQHLTWGHGLLIAISVVLLYLGIARKMEPMLLVPIGFGMLLVNLPMGGLMEYGPDGSPQGLLSRFYYYGITWDIIPPLMFLGLGALTDFTPLISNPKSFLLGAGELFGVYLVFLLCQPLGFDVMEAATIGIIGGATGPVTVYVANRLAPHILGATALVAYTYMALVPLIQPPIIRALITKKERAIYMEPTLRDVSKREEIIFPVMVAIVAILLVPESAPLIGMFMFGNLLTVSGVTERLATTAGGAFIDILTFILCLTIGASMPAKVFLQLTTLKILGLGVLSFSAATAGGLILAKLINFVYRRPVINPMIGAAGLSAIPMAARVVQKMGAKANPRNFLLMHAMGPNVAGALVSAIAAGVFLKALL